jgi:glycine hydroxymethyltransferase
LPPVPGFPTPAKPTYSDWPPGLRRPRQWSAARIDQLIDRNLEIHDQDCFNLNPATNVMNPRAEAALARGIGSRPSLGYPGDKYEMGLEAIEEIEVITAELAAEIFHARYAEIRVGSGALANLYGFMALARPGDSIIAPPGSIGGHVTHHSAGCAGPLRADHPPAPIDADGYTLDLAALHDLAHAVRPKIITVGGSLNLFPHPVAEVRKIADQVGRQGPVRRRPPMRHHRGWRLGQPPDRRRASDDDVDLQVARRPRGRADRDQRRRRSPNASTPSPSPA